MNADAKVSVWLPPPLVIWTAAMPGWLGDGGVVQYSQVQHNVLISDRKGVKTVKQLSRQEVQGEEGDGDEGGVKYVAQLREFDNIGGYSGVS